MATGPDLSSSSGGGAPDASPAAAAKRDRHIVSWSAEEDGVLRAQIALHGTDNWTIIAAQFKDKTARQCRRRWYNYLNSECKKGGWSKEEDLLLCEAQKLLGNRWTEIAKVVSGRTDNAVKNRFSTLCKRRVKDEEPFQENGAPCSNTNAKRVLTQTGCLTPGAAGSSQPIKQMRSCDPDLKENIVPNMMLFGREKSTQQDVRQPLAIISSNNQANVNIVEKNNLVSKTTTKQLFGAKQNCVKCEGNFLNKDDPKVATLLQQADLLCSLATKIKTENTSQSMDEAWQQLQHHLVKKEDNEMSENSMSGIASLLEELDDLIVDPYESKEEDEQKLREHKGQIDVHDEHSHDTSQISMEVTSDMLPDEKMEDCPVDNCKEDNSLCRNVLSGSMEPWPGAGISASENLSEVAEEIRLQSVESTSPVLIDFDDFIVDPYESKDEDEQKSREQNGQIDVHDEHSNGPSQTNMEVPSDMASDQNIEDCPEDDYNEDNNLCRNVPSRSMEPCPEIPVSEKLSEVAEDSWLQSMESTFPVLTNFQSKECAERPASENLSEVAEYSRLHHGEFTSPARIVLLVQAKAGAEILASPKFSEVAKDSELPSMEFMSPAHTVQTFQTYTDDMPTPKFTASERNFLLSVLELTSPGSRPDTSQQPSCKRALLNNL
ncbi:transcription factor MYB124-like isoform X2 [Phragmites australis]|uniref:transcription factor MYB124-like isoform X2 n=1 Tax=Phragmites australis TaxID=29695 RepID=UPI002D7793ED|nr:transcription factor MYB124-like isoform X2 [Phragmites australis]